MQITRGKIVGAQKIVIYGPEGIGKSTFASQFPNPVFIDTEGSTKHMDVARTPKPSSWTMLLEQVRYFKKNPYACDTLNIDTADWAEQLCMEEICAKAQKQSIEDFGYGKGYIYLAEEFGRFLNLLEELIELGINIVFTAHAQMRKFEQPDEMGSYDRWEMKLQKKTAPLLKEWADMVLFANYETYVIKTDDKKNKAQGGKRVIYTSHHPCWDAKNRHDLDLKLTLDYKEISHCIVTRGGNQNTKIVKEEILYWHHPESGCVFTTKPGELPGDQLCVELTKEEYDNLAAKYAELEKNVNNQTVQKAELATGASIEQSMEKKTEGIIEMMKKNDEKYNTQQTSKNDLKGVPKALADLMMPNNVTIEEIQQAVASRGYYPQDTPIENYDPNFVSGVLVGAWQQVFEMIQAIRENPFSI